MAQVLARSFTRFQIACRIVSVPLRMSEAAEEPMLGAVKGDPETEGVPLFRLLARRWKSMAPPKRERGRLTVVRVADEAPAAPRVWIEKPRQIYAHQKIAPSKPQRSWNPWLWVK